MFLISAICRRYQSPVGFRLSAISVIVIVILVLIDISVARIYYVATNQLLSELNKLLLFTFVGIICFTGQFVLLKFLSENYPRRRLGKQFALMYRAIFYLQFFFIGIFVIVVYEILSTSRYETLLLIFATSGSMGVAVIVTTNLTRQFFKWFRSEPNLVLLLYGLFVAFLSLNILASGFLTLELLGNKPLSIHYHLGITNPYSALANFQAIQYLNSVSLILAFITAWIATTLMLRQIGLRWKQYLYWIVLVLPLVYFLLQFQPGLLSTVLWAFSSDVIINSTILTLFITYSEFIGGLIFGGAFLMLSQFLNRKGIHIVYSRIAGIGFIMIFATNQLLLLAPANYPPFGLVTISLLPLSCSILFVGIHSLSLVISYDTKLRSTIRNLVRNKSNFLLSMSASESESYFLNKASEIYKALEKSVEDDIKTTVSFDDAKIYLDDVIREIRNIQAKSNEEKSSTG